MVFLVHIVDVWRMNELSELHLWVFCITFLGANIEIIRLSYKSLISALLQTWVNILDEQDFTNDKLRVSMVSFSEPDKVVHEFTFGSGLNKSAVIQRIGSTEYHSESGWKHRWATQLSSTKI